MTTLARIHVLKKQAALDEDSYRDLMQRETGKRSAKDLTAAERRAFIGVLTGLQRRFDRSSREALQPYAAKLRALWISGYWLGVISERSDTAMQAFLKRQTGLDSDRFLRNPQDGEKAIEALKDWIRRKTGNAGLFRIEAGLPALYNDPRFQVVLHLWSELIARNAAPCSTLTGYLIDTFGHGDPERLTGSDWAVVHQGLGTLSRGTVSHGVRGRRPR